MPPTFIQRERYVAELGLTPASRSRIAVPSEPEAPDDPLPITCIELVIGRKNDEGQFRETPLLVDGTDLPSTSGRERTAPVIIDHRS